MFHRQGHPKQILDPESLVYRLTPGRMTITATVVADAFPAAVIALFLVPAECGGTAKRQRPKYLLCECSVVRSLYPLF
jgi:hypothetical protein